MSRLSDLLQQLKSSHPEFARDLEREVEALQNRRAFGLNFERHVPEAVNLPGRPIRKGDKVRVLPPRSDVKSAPDRRVWAVHSIDKVAKTAELLERQLVSSEATPPELCSASLDDLVAVGEFSDPIYPGLVETGRVERGGDKPFHTVINAENYHALQALLLTHRGKVDCIYIDPPYNTGAKDWKYNNDYVEVDDHYRHSRWLAMMERRLTIARELLIPHDSALIVTIDEKEYLRLGMLLEQMFPDAKIQMISTVINPKGVVRTSEFARVNEYVYVCRFGVQQVCAEQGSSAGGAVPMNWQPLRRSDIESARYGAVYRKEQFYPIFVRTDGAIDSIGPPLPRGVDRMSVTPPLGCEAVFPVREDGTEIVWGISASTFKNLHAQGFVRTKTHMPEKPQSWMVQYLTSGRIKDIKDGKAVVLRREATGEAVIEYGSAEDRLKMPVNQWSRESHNAQHYGTILNQSFVPGRRFPFPKSLYAVEDTLRYLMGNKPGGIVLDFFAGSGTTSHAVMRLNRQDGGCRQSVSVTNNEVKNEEQSALRDSGLRPGDPDWEKWGICDYITKPRIAAAISGIAFDGTAIDGDYKFTDEFPMSDGLEENAVFYTLTYESPLAVTQHRAFERVAPLLWLRAGAQGRRIDTIPTSGWDVAERYGVIDNLGAAGAFVEALAATPTATQAFIATDDDALFRDVARQLPKGCEPVQLYRAYLDIFENDAMRGTK